MSSVSDKAKAKAKATDGGKLALSILLIFVVVVCSVATSVIFPGWKSPADWLLAWTSWVGSVVGIVVAARVFWAGSNVANEFALKMKRGG